MFTYCTCPGGRWQAEAMVHFLYVHSSHQTGVLRVCGYLLERLVQFAADIFLLNNHLTCAKFQASILNTWLSLKQADGRGVGGWEEESAIC